MIATIDDSNGKAFVEENLEELIYSDRDDLTPVIIHDSSVL